MNEPVVVEQPWYCETCGADALLTHYSDTDAGRVKGYVLEQHRRMSPECTADDIVPIRFRDRVHTDKKERAKLAQSE